MKLNERLSQIRSFSLPGLIFFIFFQLLTEFVEAIYLFGLLGTDIPPEIGLVILFFSPILVFLFKKRLIPPYGNKILLTLALLARGVEIMLPTRGRLFVSGIGVAALLLFFTSHLATKSSEGFSKKIAKEVGAGLCLALFGLILAKGVNSGSDITGQGMFRILSWGIILLGIFLVWKGPQKQNETQSPSTNTKKFKVYIGTLGISGVIVLVYFIFSAPNIISRWGGTSNLVTQGLLLLSWIFFCFWWLRGNQFSTRLTLGIGMLFTALLMFSILPHQIKFPSEMASYPLPSPMINPWQDLVVYLMVLVSPILLVAFTKNLTQVISQQTSPSILAGAFSVSSGFLLLMILSQVFTTVYDYIPVIGPFFRDKYWLVLLLPAIIAFLPFIFQQESEQQTTPGHFQNQKFFMWMLLGLGIATIFGLSLIPATRPLWVWPEESKNSLKVLTYNIQQGYNDQGERNFDGQLNYIRRFSPDIIGLQECDTARIAGGNTDIVAYFANQLNMYSYYGPSPVAGTFGIALLSRYPIENAKTFFLFSYGEQVAVIEADISVGNKTFKVFVTHLGNGGPIFQMEQMLELMNNQSNLIAMGDFNFRPYEDQYAITTKEFNDAYLLAESKSIPTLWGNKEPFDISERIDHIFISDELKVPYLEYLTEPESDHPGLFARIGW